MLAEVLAPLNSGKVDPYFRPDYIQHSPMADDGSPAQKAFLDWTKGAVGRYAEGFRQRDRPAGRRGNRRHLGLGRKGQAPGGDQLQARMLGVAMASHGLQLNELTWRQALPVLRPLDIGILCIASNANVAKEIAKALDLLPEVVHERWRSIRRKLGAWDRAHACTIAASIGPIPPPDRAMDLVLGRFSGGDGDE